jgi:hypothetical protein
MKTNLGSADKIIRLILSGIIAFLYFTGIVGGTVGIVLMIVAGVLTLTTVINFCPLYFLFGISTCKKSLA